MPAPHLTGAQAGRHSAMTVVPPAAAAPGAPVGVSPAEFADFLPTSVMLSSASQNWRHVTLQRLRYPPGVINLPAGRDHRLALHLDGLTLIADEQGSRERRWSDSGHVSLIPAGVPKARDIKGRPDFLLIHIAPALVDEVVMEAYDRDPAGVTLLDRLAVPDEILERLGRLLLAEAENVVAGGALAAESLTRALVVNLLRRHSSLAPQASFESRSIPKGRLLQVLDYMRANLTDSLPLTHLAAISGTSPSRFARAFREATGEPPHHHLIRLRIEQARHLLEHTTLPIIEVGSRCGYDRPNHFATIFRQIMGMSPRAYRQARRTP